MAADNILLKKNVLIIPVSEPVVVVIMLLLLVKSTHPCLYNVMSEEFVYILSLQAKLTVSVHTGMASGYFSSFGSRLEIDQE